MSDSLIVEINVDKIRFIFFHPRIIYLPIQKITATLIHADDGYKKLHRRKRVRLSFSVYRQWFFSPAASNNLATASSIDLHLFVIYLTPINEVYEKCITRESFLLHTD